MASKAFKITFSLDEHDSAYFQSLYKEAKKNAKAEDAAKIQAEVKALIDRVRSVKRAPHFVTEAITTLEDLMQMLDDKDYKLPRPQYEAAVAGLAYFANPKDVIPDHIPALGFLDDAIMISFVAEDFKHELWAYRKFRAFRGGAEQRPWTNVAQDRLPRRLEEYRKELRQKVVEKTAGEKARSSRTGIRRFTW
jgi:uncharacterized membrane protein YkvA (DUF1232 family)